MFHTVISTRQIPKHLPGVSPAWPGTVIDARLLHT